MKLLADVNVSPQVVQLLRAAGHDAVRVTDVLDARAPDEEVLAEAARRDAVLVSRSLHASGVEARTPRAPSPPRRQRRAAPKRSSDSDREDRAARERRLRMDRAREAPRRDASPGLSRRRADRVPRCLVRCACREVLGRHRGCARSAPLHPDGAGGTLGGAEGEGVSVPSAASLASVARSTSAPRLFALLSSSQTPSVRPS